MSRTQFDVVSAPLSTVENARDFFLLLDNLRAEGKPFPPVGHVFFAKVDDGLEFEPYHLRAVSRENRPNNYFIVTKEHIVHVNRMLSKYETVGTVKDWLREAALFASLRELPFFRKYLKTKAFFRLIGAVRAKRFEKRRCQVSKRALICQPQFGNSIRLLSKSIYDLQWKQDSSNSRSFDAIRCFAIYAKKREAGLSAEQFLSIQNRHSRELKKYIADVLLHILSVIVKKAKDTESAMLNLSPVVEKKGTLGVVNKEVAAAEQHAKDRLRKKTIVDYGNIGNLVRLAHQMQLEAIFKQACNSFFELGGVVGAKEASKNSMWFFRVDCVVDRGRLSLVPSQDHLLDLSKNVLSNSLSSLANLPTAANSSELQKDYETMSVLTPSIAFAHDTLLTQYTETIKDKIVEDYEDALKKLSVYEPFMNSFNFATEWDVVALKWSTILNTSDSPLGTIHEADFRQYISKAMKLQSDVKKLTSRNFGTIYVACDVTISSTTDKLEDIIKQIFDSLKSLTESQFETLKEERNEWVEKLHTPELSLEEYISWFTQTEEAEDKYDTFANYVSDLQNLYHLRTELHEKVADGKLEEPDFNAVLREPFLAALTEAKRYHTINLPKMRDRVTQEHDKIISNLHEMQKRLDDLFGSLKANEGGSATKNLMKVQESLNRRRQEARRLDEHGEVLQMSSLNWTEIGVADECLKKYQELWKIHDETETLKANLRTVSVQELSGQELKDTVISLFQRSFKASKITHGDAADSLVETLGEEKTKVPLYVELCNPALKEDHWQSIFQVTNIDSIPANNRTLRALDAAGLLSGNEDDITAIVSNAVGVFELEQHIAKIEKFWDECTFGVSPYASRANAFVIDGADEILEELEEQQVVIQTCLASKYLADVKSKVEEWEQKLATIHAVIVEWVSVQKAWMYLEFIFSSDDIKRQLPDESLLFSSADRFFSTLMKRCSTNPQVAPLCLEGGDALKKLQKCTYQLDCIQKKLDEYLETKRVAFPRFYFLSNDELLSILSDSRNPLAVQPHLQKCFDNIKELIFADTKTITSMKSSEGEIVTFSNEVKIMGNVESWLNDVERAMRDTLYDALAKSVATYSHDGRHKWFFDHPAQCVSTTDQIIWTADVEKVISDYQKNPAAWPDYLEWFKKQLLETVDLVKGNLNPLQRTIVSNLIVVDVHCRDVCYQLADAKCDSIVNFDWQKQLRFYWAEPSPDSTVKDCVIRHGAAQLSYGYEYLGNQPRLVITPLTERAFLTCTAALHMQKGAAPQGPAGTGKTESVKDLGKALARQVVVFNCSDGLNYKMMSQMFAGLAQGGAWACFDEFNRIELEVLSVVAQQMLDITTAIANKQTSMSFEGHRIKLHPNFGVFITMNPGYAGRTELPDNLKALFRPICMMIPNYALIAEIMFYSEGYTNAGVLANKMIRLYSLASQQLSKQDHYDFGMRAVKSILVLAGRLKRAEPDTNEELLLVKAIRDANLPKFLTDDTHLFIALMKDFFPDVEEVKTGAVNIVIGDETKVVLTAKKLEATDGIIMKSQQLFDTLTTRHGLMLVGHTMTGKSTIRDSLAEVLTRLGEDPAKNEHLGSRYLSYFTTTIQAECNPKSITMTELYGDVNPLTREWQDGIFSSIVRELVKEASIGSTQRHWVVFDGPVDAIWIENLNTVLDDSKMLCLVNGERIRIPETISCLFEVQDLRVASPATVSRCGMVYVDEETLEDGYSPLLRSLSLPAAAQYGQYWRHDRFMELCALVLPPMLSFIREECKEYIRSVNAQLARNMFMILKAAVSSLAVTEPEAEETEEEAKKKPRAARNSKRKSTVAARASAILLGDVFFDAVFIQSCAWGLGGNLADGYRDRFSAKMLGIIREAKLNFPSEAEEMNRGVFDYCIDTEVGDWRPWSELVPAFHYDASLSFFDLVVPTEHTVVLNYLLQTATKVQHHVLLNGLTGTAKSSTVTNFILTSLRSEDADSQYVAFSYTLSAQTSSNNLQETIESKLTKRKGDKELGPPINKKVMIAVIDDCNVPQLEEYGAAPPIELMRQMISQGGFYDRKKLFFKQVVHTMLIACCGEPGGGKNELTPRFSSKMLTFCVPQLSQAAMQTIYVSILRGFYEARSFNEEVTQLAEAVVACTLEAYRRIAVECLPTPEKTHCTFNLRDVSKVIQGMLQIKPANCESKEQLMLLWSHEASRVFHDRLVDDSDRNWWWRCGMETIHKHFHDESITTDSLRKVMYGNWGSRVGRDYMLIPEGPQTQEVVYQCLAEYNMQSAASMDLVLFEEAVQHLSRICRIINQPRGHALLVGVGGSGRTSLCRLAASMMNMDLQTVNIVRGYGPEHFRDEMRKALLDGGARGKEVVFQLSDPQIVCSEMLEDVNNVLNIGEVPGMMRLEDMEVILRFCREPCLTAGRPDTRSSIYQYFVARCRERMHVALCMSPMSASFRDRLRMFPALVNCTTIDWFTEWPKDALLAVASAVLKRPPPADAKNGAIIKVDQDEEKISALLVHIHASVKVASRDLYAEHHRRNHTTPTSYLGALALFQLMVQELAKQIEYNAKRYRTGLEKLDGANSTIAGLKKQISDMQPALTAAAEKAETQKRTVQKEQKEADVLKEEQSKEEAAAKELMADAESIRLECEEGLAEAMPALEAAERALQTISAKDIQEIKTFTTPPGNVEKTMNAVLILLKEKEGWASAKSCLNKLDFLTRLTDYPRDEMSAPLIRKLAVFVNDPEFVPDVIEKTSLPCRSMCMWAHAMYQYYFVAKEVAPKRERLREAEKKVAAARSNLEAKQRALQLVLDRIVALEAAAREAQETADKLNRDIETAKARLHRADQLTSGLASERVRWEASLKDLDFQRTRIVGTAALGAGCVAYLGAFTAPFRHRLVLMWREKCEELGITFNANFSLESMMSEATIQQWSLQSLPRDTYSIQNATILARSARWCYMIDPQGQANSFIRKKESGGGQSLLVLKLTDDNFMRSIENAVQIGQPVLLENVGETLDAALDPILLRQVRRVGGRNVVTIGDKEVTYDDHFRLFITTKLSNPVLTPELQVKVTVVNFTVTREGLEDQLLADIVGSEREALQRSSDRCIVSIASNREEIRALEEQVLRMLNESTGDVLDNIELINALQVSKTTSEKIATELAIVEETNAKISATREKYRPLACRGSLIYSVIADLAKVDPMYEYSLQFFKTLVVSVLENTRSGGGAGGYTSVGAELTSVNLSRTHSILDRPKSRSMSVSVHKMQETEDTEMSDEQILGRVTMLMEELTWASFRVICRGLFETHKLLFSFLLATTIMKSTDAITEDEWSLFLRGSVGQTIPDEFSDEKRPPYMDTVMWGDFGALCGTDTFVSIKNDFFGDETTWSRWFTDLFGEQVLAQLPQSITSLSLWHQTMLLKAIRPDKLHSMVKALVGDFLGSRYTRAPPFIIGEAFKDSTKLTPIIFVLSPGTDPTVLFSTFADEMGFGDRKYMLSLGQDQGPRAESMILDGRRDGSWVYLQNCHVYASWMPRLQLFVESINPAETHDDFRLWLTSSPSADFPSAVLQAGMKLTREPPMGLKGKLRDTLNANQVIDAWSEINLADVEGLMNASDSNLQETAETTPAAALKKDVTKTARWKRLSFALAMLHGVVLERRVYCPLGWNKAYDWAAPDYVAGLSTITTALGRFEEDEPTPWAELSFMLGTIDYGGRVTDMWDTRCLEVIALQFFSEEAGIRHLNAATATAEERKRIGFLPVLPEDCSYEDLLDFVEREVPDVCSPEMFGLHYNASISVDRKHSAEMVQSLVRINTGGGAGAASSDANSEDGPVMQMARSLLERLPKQIARSQAVASSQDPSEAPLRTLLAHEVDLYNGLIREMDGSLKEIIRALKGEVVMTGKTERMAMRLSYNQVPDTWHSRGYLSLKPLGSYYEDFLKRIEFISEWRHNGVPPSFWLPGLFFPQGFITAILQARSRAIHAPIDSLHFQFRVFNQAESAAARKTRTPGLVGAYVHGLYLEGCGWDDEACGLVESRPGALTVELPVVHFEPVAVTTPPLYDIIYECPLYKVSSRAGTLSTTGVSTNYIVSLMLPSLKGVPGDHWTLRGVAGLCSLDV